MNELVKVQYKPRKLTTLDLVEIRLLVKASHPPLLPPPTKKNES
jgi:hypothetical protein